MQTEVPQIRKWETQNIVFRSLVKRTGRDGLVHETLQEIKKGKK